LDDLVGAFATEVLAWETCEVVGNASESSEPQVFTLASTTPDVSIAFAAIPSRAGWGFVQIGEGMSASASSQEPWC